MLTLGILRPTSSKPRMGRQSLEVKNSVAPAGAGNHFHVPNPAFHAGLPSPAPPGAKSHGRAMKKGSRRALRGKKVRAANSFQNTSRASPPQSCLCLHPAIPVMSRRPRSRPGPALRRDHRTSRLHSRLENRRKQWAGQPWLSIMFLAGAAERMTNNTTTCTGHGPL